MDERIEKIDSAVGVDILLERISALEEQAKAYSAIYGEREREITTLKEQLVTVTKELGVALRALGILDKMSGCKGSDCPEWKLPTDKCDCKRAALTMAEQELAAREHATETVTAFNAASEATAKVNQVFGEENETHIPA